MFSIQQSVGFLFDVFNMTENVKGIDAYEIALEEEDPGYVERRVKQLAKTWKPEFGKKMPSVSDIIGVQESDLFNAELEKKWEEYLKLRNDHLRFKVIPSWVYTMRNMLGGQRRSEEATDDDLIWIKKEFVNLYPSMAKGFIELREDPSSQGILQAGDRYLISKNGVIDGFIKPKELTE